MVAAHSAAWVRSVTPICWKMLVRWALTVRSAMPSGRAICLLANPVTNRRSTSSSRALSALAGRGAWRESRRTRAALGSRGAPPAAAARIAAITASGWASFSR